MRWGTPEEVGRNQDVGGSDVGGEGDVVDVADAQ